MQILESSDFGLRSARIQLHGADPRQVVTLFPMIHIGDAGFYDGVYRDAFAHDVVLAEGINSPVTTRITRSYRWIPSARLELVIQPKYPVGCRAEIVRADLSPDEFAAVWRTVPRYWKLMLYVVAPIYGLHQRWTATRANLAKGHSLDDLPGRDEILSWSPEIAPLHHAILDARDRRLVNRLDEVLRRQGPQSIAIVYGARHMRTILAEFVGRRAFRVGDMDWMTVISL